MELDIESLRIPSLHSRYLQLLTEHSLLLKKTQGDLAVLKRNKWIYYTGKASEDVYKEKGDFPLKLKTKDEERTFIEADDEIRELCHTKDHDCATVVEHPVWGKGKPLLKSHAIPDDNGYVAWYDVCLLYTSDAADE